MIQAQILELLKGIARDFGMAIILVTHDLGVVAQVCDRIVVMYGGGVAEENEAARLSARRSTLYPAAAPRSPGPRAPGSSAAMAVLWRAWLVVLATRSGGLANDVDSEYRGFCRYDSRN